jgi:predicted Zn-dependent protease
LYGRIAQLGLVACLALGAAGTSGCTTTPVTGRQQFNLLSTEDDKALGGQAYGEMLKDAQFIESGPQYDQVQRVVARLVAVADDPGGFEWEAKLVKDDATANAWCLPGGKMAVYTGILPFTQDDAGLAVVMAHEIGHAVARHGSERMTQSMGLEIAVQLAQGYQWAQYAPAAANLLLFMPFGRNQELEADHIGLMYMARAGYDPSEAEQFWKRMAAGKSGAPPEFLSTHPSDETRIQQIRDLLPEAMAEYKASGPKP